MTNKINLFALIKKATLVLLAFFITFSAFAQDSSIADPHAVALTSAPTEQGNEHQAATKEPVDITKVAFEHILDSHTWHLWGEGHDAVSIGLPVILYSNTKGLQMFSSSKFEHGHASYNGYSINEEQIHSEDSSETIYDLSLTKNACQLIFSAILLILIFTSIAKSYRKTGITSAPTGKQSFFEPLITFVRDDIAKSNIGHSYEKYVPYLLTVFFLILINNVLGIIPVSANLTGNIAFTLVLSVATLIITNINGNGDYWHHIFMPPCPWWLYPIMIPIEIIGILTKPFALMIRLFANISAGHIIIISLIGLIFVFESVAIAPVSVAFALFIDVLECLVAFLQAYIFTMLTALFIGSAVADHNHDGAHTSDDYKTQDHH